MTAAERLMKLADELADAALHTSTAYTTARLKLLAEVERVCSAAESVVRDGSGRSGGSVYMVHKEPFLSLRAALSPRQGARP